MDMIPSLVFVFFISLASTLINADDILSSPEYEDLMAKSNYEWQGRFPKWTGTKRYSHKTIVNPVHKTHILIPNSKYQWEGRIPKLSGIKRHSSGKVVLKMHF